MEITLEQIDLIRQRTGAGYKEAREVLEAAGGSLVDALVLLEGTEGVDRQEYSPQAGGHVFEGMQDRKSQQQEGEGRKSTMMRQNRIVSGLMDFSKKSKIKITLPGERKVEIPAVLGVAGVVLMPKMAALSGLALLLAKSSLAMDYSAGKGQGPELGEETP